MPRLKAWEATTSVGVQRLTPGPLMESRNSTSVGAYEAAPRALPCKHCYGKNFQNLWILTQKNASPIKFITFWLWMSGRKDKSLGGVAQCRLPQSQCCLNTCSPLLEKKTWYWICFNIFDASSECKASRIVFKTFWADLRLYKIIQVTSQSSTLATSLPWIAFLGIPLSCFLSCLISAHMATPDWDR